ncbi:Uncharacterized protein GBIM_18846, partial [Gryllus bimaculatus]
MRSVKGWRVYVEAGMKAVGAVRVERDRAEVGLREVETGWGARREVHPVIQVPNQLVGAPTGTDVTLECYVEASPRSINYWVREK